MNIIFTVIKYDVCEFYLFFMFGLVVMDFFRANIQYAYVWIVVMDFFHANNKYA